LNGPIWGGTDIALQPITACVGFATLPGALMRPCARSLRGPGRVLGEGWASSTALVAAVPVAWAWAQAAARACERR